MPPPVSARQHHGRRRSRACPGIERIDRRLYIIRHADPDYKRDAINESGHIAARALADYLSTQNIDKIYSSPLGRAMETAQYTSQRLGIPIIQKAWMQELTQLWIPKIDQTLWDMPGSDYRSNEFRSQLNTWQTVPSLNRPRLADVVKNLHQQSDGFLAQQGFVRKCGIYTQLAENRDVISVFVQLLTGNQIQIDIKPIHDYIRPNSQVNFHTVVASALRKGETAIGYRLLSEASDAEQSFGVHINPAKSKLIPFSDLDQVIVLARSDHE